MSFTIRPTTKEDAPQILAFIKELAIYEKLAHEAIATVEDIEKTLFCERPFAYCVLAFEDETAVGFSLYFYNYSTFLGKPGLYLEDLFVDPDHRGKGYGKALLQYLASLALEQNCGRFEWSVLDWNTPAIDFYRSIGSIAMDGWTINRMDHDAMLKFVGQ